MPISPELLDRVARNVARARHLVTVYEGYAGAGPGRRDVESQDILRAATVFVHAALEDFVRTLAAERLPHAAGEALDQVPLVGQEGRASKFFLGALATHRGKTVDAVLAESVSAHLQRVSYNDTTEISSAIDALGLDSRRANARFADLDEMISRRHHIVHQADRNPRRGKREGWAQSISRDAVNRWIGAVEEFVAAVARQVP